MNRSHEDMDDMAEHAAVFYTSKGPLKVGARKLPKGCDYQGRFPQAAEACTELGADDEDQSESADSVVWPWLLFFFIVFVLLAWHGYSWWVLLA